MNNDMVRGFSFGIATAGLINALWNQKLWFAIVWTLWIGTMTLIARRRVS